MPEIPGKVGTWEYDVTSGTPDQIHVKYKPRRAANCRDIFLSQTAKKVAFDANGKEVPGPPENWWTDGYPYEHVKPDRVTDPDGRMVHLDHVACEADPFYNGEDSPHGKYSRGDSTTGASSELTDAPATKLDKTKFELGKIITYFETCAICAETGEVLGCMSWSSSAVLGDPGTIAVDPAKELPSTPSYDKALRRFVRNHTRRGPTGRLHWWCPETVPGGVKGPNGTCNDPFGLPVPNGFRKKWLAPLDLRLSREIAGGGVSMATPQAVLELAQGDPEMAAVKFTWSGEQEKTTPSVLFTTLTDLSAADIAPYVEDLDRFTNDFLALKAYVVTRDFLTTLLQELRRLSALAPSDEWPVVVSIVAGLRTEASAAYTGAIKPRRLNRLVRRVARHRDTDEDTLEALTYLALNMGGGRASAPPRRPRRAPARG